MNVVAESGVASVTPLRRGLDGVFHVLSVGRPSPAVKQYPTTILFAVAVIAAAALPTVGFTNPATVIAGCVLVALATAFAIVASSSERLAAFAILVPLVDLVAIGALRTGTGGGDSPFNALLLLPVLWIAAERKRWYIALAAIGMIAALLMPALFTFTTPSSASDWLRDVILPLTFLIAAAIVNELARQLRAQYRSAAQLADEKETMLQRTVEYAAQLQENEAKFRATERMFRGVWAAVTEQSVIATDPEGLIDAWNPGATKLLGPTAERAEDHMHIFDFHVPDELDAYAKELGYPHGATVLNPGFSALVEHARQGLASNRDWSYVRSDGSRVPVLLSVTARRDQHGEINGYLFIATDQTRALELSKLKDDFVGLVSHELRTPLSSILGYLELMRDDEGHDLSDQQLQYLSVAERNAHRLLRLVGDLLFTAQVDSGRFPLDLQDAELGPIVAAAVDSARPIAEQAGIALACVGQGGAALGGPGADAFVHVRGDATRLGQAVDNLISNAIKFTPRGGSVTVTLGSNDTSASIEVKDTGLGIPADELELLFGRFFRATTATRNAVPGVGLGLTITQAIVAAHGGTIEVASIEGAGTSFTVTLPRAA